MIKLKVTAEDNKTVKEYTLNLKPADKTAPLVTEIEVGSRKADSAVLSYTSSEAATGYYVVSAKDAEEMDAAAIKENGTQFTAAEGKNTEELKNLTKAAAKIQFVPVSYTHLDVYKRQGLRRGHGTGQRDCRRKKPL